jgi:hypothetical protein
MFDVVSIEWTGGPITFKAFFNLSVTGISIGLGWLFRIGSFTNASWKGISATNCSDAEWNT